MSLFAKSHTASHSSIDDNDKTGHMPAKIPASLFRRVTASVCLYFEFPFVSFSHILGAVIFPRGWEFWHEVRRCH